MDNATALVQQPKERLQSQHDGLGHIEGAGAMTRLMWECVEVLAKRPDGVAYPVMRDYLAESDGGDRRATGCPPRRGWWRK